MIGYTSLNVRRALEHLSGIKRGCPGLHETSEYSELMAENAHREAGEALEEKVKAEAVVDKKRRQSFTHAGGAPPAKRQTTLNLVGRSKDYKIADEAIARFWYDSGLAFDKATRLSFEEMIQYVSEAGKGYKFRGKNYLRTDGLETEQKRLVKNINGLIGEVSPLARASARFLSQTCRM